MAETPRHRKVMNDVIETLDVWFEDDPEVYVSGNMMMFYVEGNPRKHVSPDVFVTCDIPKLPERRIYQVWVEGKGPDVVMEITSKLTRREDLEVKFALYRDVLKVREYFLFDPYAEYLKPPLQGYRRRGRHYGRMRTVQGRLPSQVLGLHLERAGWQLRLFNPATGKWLRTPEEERVARQQAELARQQAELARQQEAAARQQEAAARQLAEAERIRAQAEIEQLRRELETLRRQLPRQA